MLEILRKLNKNESTEAERFKYAMLDRLASDCKYYLGYGNRCAKYLWAGDEKKHIAEMKKIYNSLDKKPEWVTWQQILEFEKQMQG